MNTGLKILIRKIIFSLKHPKFLYSQIPADKFPKKSISIIKTRARLFGVENELVDRKIEYNLGTLHTKPHPIAVKTYQSFIKHNPNNLGNWSNSEPDNGTEQLEYEIIKKMADLHGISKEKANGSVTSGGTEGNIFSLWLGRSYLEKLCIKNTICLLKTSLTHYSVAKAGNICDIHQFLIPLNTKEWNMDPSALSKKIKSLYKDGYRGFLIPLTIGYTLTGTQDDLKKITQAVKNLQSELKKIYFFIWVDAALNGLIEPFINSDFKPFSFSLIQTIVVDFHKFGMVPYSAGVVVYRKNLRKIIEKKVEYFKEKDSTLLGSRQGASVASIWSIINNLGRSGFRKIISKQLMNKKYFIKNVKDILPMAEIITNKNSLTCGVIFHSQKNQRLSKYLEEKYWLYPGVTNLFFENNIKKTQTIYKFIFLPHLEKNILKTFFLDIKKFI